MVKRSKARDSYGELPPLRNAPKSGSYPIGVISDPSAVEIAPVSDDGGECLLWAARRQVVLTLVRHVAEHPDDLEALCDLGLAQLALGAWNLAEEACDRALTRRPDHLRAHLIRAAARRTGERYVGALRDCQRAVRIDPRCAAAHAELGRVHLALDEPQDAIAALDLAVALDSTDADLYAVRAEVREALGDLAGAVEDLSIARAMRPADATLVEALRLARRRLGSGSEPAPSR
jgi:tetratricopeptide (TPR) repeat protein